MIVLFQRAPRWRRIRKKRQNLKLCARTLTSEPAHTRNVTDSMCASNVMELLPTSHVSSVKESKAPQDLTWEPSPSNILHKNTLDGTVITAKKSINTDALKAGLSQHPDKDFVDRVVEYSVKGVPIFYEGPRLRRISPNWPSAYKYSDSVVASISKNIAQGRMAGPFPSPPFKNFVGSPMGAFPKKRSDRKKIRVIHDLSWPPGSSVNDGIQDENCHVQYMTVDDVVHQLHSLGRGALVAKLDLKDAFHHICVRPEDWELLGSSFETTDLQGNSTVQYFVSMVLPFGLRSSPKQFSEFAKANKLIMLYNGASYVDNYLDDYITAGHPNSDECATNLSIMLETCNDVGFEINPDKIEPPTTMIEFLGIIMDTVKWELRISEQRLTDILMELEQWLGRKKATKRELLSLIGKLSFISRVVRPGRTFIRRIINLSKKAKHLHHRLKLTKSCRSDIEWWLDYLPTWNGVGMFYEENWICDYEMEMFMDARSVNL